MQTFEVNIAGTTHTLRLDDAGGIEMNGAAVNVGMSAPEGHAITVHMDGTARRVVAVRDGEVYRVLLDGMEEEVVVRSERDLLIRRYAKGVASGSLRMEIHAPMPALVSRVEVAPGDEVAEGQGLVVLEAMKMENELRAPHQARVKEVLVTRGQAVEKGQLLLLLEEHGAAESSV